MFDLHELTGAGKLYFVRHGESEGYERGLIKGHSDYALTERGRSQAQSTAEWFARKPIDLILSSPLKRARETAEIIAKRNNMADVKVIPELKELDTGLFTGITQKKAQERYPDEFARFRLTSWEGVSGAEKIPSLYGRAEAFWRNLTAFIRDGRRNIISVSHKGMLQWILRLPFGAKTWMPLLEIDFCGIYRLSYDVSEENHFLIWDLMNFVAWGKESGLD